MLIHLEQSIKTSLLVLLFITCAGYSSSGNPKIALPLFVNSLNHPEQQFNPSSDTINTQSTEIKTVNQENTFLIPARFSGSIFEFQINEAISYLRFSHFVKDESKKMFFQAWMKEKEVKQLAQNSDSLRKVYAQATSDQKEKIAVLILKDEERSMALNSEIPTLYQTAREQEGRYWQLASPTEKNKFQEKIKLLRDSMTNIRLIEENRNNTKTIADTIVIYKESPTVKEQKPEVISEAVVYKIQIGTYKGKIPDVSNKMIKKLSLLRKVENYTDEKGVKIYTTGSLKTYQEAVTLQSQVKQEGVKTPTIVAYKKGKKIPIEEARKLNGEKL
jgi:hypothetical protein